MADKTAQQKEVESTVEEVDKSKTEETAESENGDSTENGESETKEKENGKDADEEEEEEETVDAASETDKVCSVKRKSTGGADAPKDTPAEGATPEKKAKLSETTEAESNGEAEVAA